MTPATVQALKELVRHQRALATSVEKWVKSPSFSREEALTLVFMFRGVLDSYEAQLDRVDTAGT